MKKAYYYDTKEKGTKTPTDFVKWLRRNFGERGEGWDFTFNQGRVIIEIWYPRLQVMYEMWYE